jgi:hypothetical protein
MAGVRSNAVHGRVPDKVVGCRGNADTCSKQWRTRYRFLGRKLVGGRKKQY